MSLLRGPYNGFVESLLVFSGWIYLYFAVGCFVFAAELSVGWWAELSSDSNQHLRGLSTTRLHQSLPFVFFSVRSVVATYHCTARQHFHCQ